MASAKSKSPVLQCLFKHRAASVASSVVKKEQKADDDQGGQALEGAQAVTPQSPPSRSKGSGKARSLASVSPAPTSPPPGSQSSEKSRGSSGVATASKAPSGARTAPQGYINFTSDKKRYNAFAYKLKLVPDATRAQWKVIKAMEVENPHMFNSYVNEVIAYDVTASVSKKRTIAKVNEKGAHGEWFGFKFAEQKEGYDVLVEQIRANLIEHRPHPRLPPNSAIQWPYNLQVRLVTEKDKAKKRSSEEESENIMSQTTDDLNDWEAKFTSFQLTHFSNMGGGNGGSAPTDSQSQSTHPSQVSLPPGIEPMRQVEASADELRDRACVAHIRKAHNAWDKNKREFEGCITGSKKCPNTKGCKFETDLKECIDQGSACDASLVALEQKYLCNIRFSEAEVKMVSDVGAQLKQTIKTGGKIQVALKSWFKI